jgi:hypothetical protein
MKYNYPLIAKWTENTYAVKENANDPKRVDFICINDPSRVFINDRSKEAFESLIGNTVTILSPIVKEEAPADLTITVESSALDRTLETAKELEATLLRVKALMP